MNVVTVTMNPSIDVSTATAKVEPIHKMRCKDVKRDPGGGGINVARAIKTLGGECTAIFAAGGLYGRFLQKLVELEGVPSVVIEIEAETRESFTALDESSGQQYRFVLPGPELRESEWRATLDRVASLAPRPDYLVISGTLPTGVPASFMGEVARIVRSWDARLVVDSSGAALAAALEARVHLVKPNLRELREYTGRPLKEEAEQIAAAAALVESGKAEIVVLTLGADGALVVTRDLRLRAPGIPVKVVSAVGAGDSFLAGMVWRLSAGGGLDEALRYGVAAGTSAVLGPGTELCRQEETERLQREVRLVEV